MTMTNAEWCIKNGIQFKNLMCITSYKSGQNSVGYYTSDGRYHGCYKGKLLGGTASKTILAWLDMEHVEPILDDAEKRYLSAVIRPFRGRVKYIEKIDCACEEYILIQLNGDWTILPHFRTGTMYIGMKPDQGYTLEELGL